MPLDRHISVFAEPAFEPRNVLSLRGEATSRRPRISRQASTRQVLVYTKNKQPVTTKETAEEDEEDWIKFPRTTTLLIIGVVLTTVGIFRDVFLQKPVRIMNSYLEIYASPCFIGALATALIIRLCPSQHLCGSQRAGIASMAWRTTR